MNPHVSACRQCCACQDNAFDAAGWLHVAVTAQCKPTLYPACDDKCRQHPQAKEPLELPHAFGAMPAPIFERDPSVDDRIAAERIAANEAAAAAQVSTLDVGTTLILT